MKADFSWNAHCQAEVELGATIDTRLIATARKIAKSRAYRSQHLDRDLLSDPVWDMLLELYSEQFSPRHSTLTSLSAASGLPISTALRYIRTMEQRGLLQRMRDQHDARIVHVRLSDQALEKMRAILFRELSSKEP